MNPSSLLQATLKLFAVVALLISIVFVLFGRFATKSPEEWVSVDTQRSLDGSWAAYRQTFIYNGQLKRPLKQHDSLAEGQANAMMRAVWLGDRADFDALYRWSEQAMSRRRNYNDNLLAHRMGPDANGSYVITEWNAPTDANLDYAFALLQAHYRWGRERSTNPTLPAYRDKAVAVAKDILAKAIVVHPGTRELVQLPWCRSELIGQEASVLLCPADYSPAHYRLFFNETNDPKWKQMLDNAYTQMDRLLTSVDGVSGAGLAPDWVRMRQDGKFIFDAMHKQTSMEESFRMWWRVRMDLHLSGEPRARQLLEKWLAPFIPEKMGDKEGILAASYTYDGEPNPKARYENPGALGTLAWALEGLSSGLAATQLRNRLFEKYTFKNDTTGEIYFAVDAGNDKDYYVNTWAWYGQAVDSWAWPFERLEATPAAAGGRASSPPAPPSER